MGATNSKEDIKNVSTDYKNADLLDMIAAKYILTQNFKDMEKLSQNTPFSRSAGRTAGMD